jgi:P27 family predicted phage terminase small subunit
VGKRGPLPKPTKLKELEGNPGHRPLPTDEPTPPVMSRVPDPPDWMEPMAQRAWRVVAGELAGVNLLHQLDMTTLELFAITYAHWRTMIKALAETGHTKTFTDEHGNEKYSQATPEATQATKYAEQLNKLCRVLGIGPAHRVGLHVGTETRSTGNPILDLLGGSSGPPDLEAGPKTAVAQIEQPAGRAKAKAKAKPVSKPKAKPVSKPKAKPVSKPKAKPVSKPKAKLVSKPKAKA